MIKLQAEDRRLIRLLLTPSWISGLIAIVVGLIASVGVILVLDAHNSVFQQELLSWQQSRPQHALTTPGKALPENNHPSLGTTWPLLLVWGLVGMAVYVMASSLFHSAAQVEDLRESLDYVNAKPQAVLVSTAERALIRIVAAVLLISFTVAIWRQVIPYSITASHASAANLVSLNGGLYDLLSFALIALSLHVETVLLRLSMGRARLFS